MTRSVVRRTDEDLLLLANVLNDGQRVTLFCGIGRADAHSDVLALAAKLQAPVGYSFRGCGMGCAVHPRGHAMRSMLRSDARWT